MAYGVLISDLMRDISRQPLILVGTGRCGSTIIYSCLAMHPDFAWISSWQTLAPRWPAISLGNRFWDLPRTDRWRERRRFPKPVEPNVVWQQWIPDFFREDADPQTLAAAGFPLSHLIDRVCRYQGRRRYLSKVVGRPVKVELLAELFADAKFIHITRDLKPTVSSLLLVDFYERNVPLDHWPWGDLTPAVLQWYHANGEAPEIGAAITVVLNRLAIEQQLASIETDRWMEISYTDFILDPVGSIRKISEHADFVVDAAYEARLRSRKIRSGTDLKWTKHFSREQIARLDRFEEEIEQLVRDGTASSSHQA